MRQEDYVTQLRQVLDRYHTTLVQSDQLLQKVNDEWQRIQGIIIETSFPRNSDNSHTESIGDDNPLEELGNSARQIRDIADNLPEKISEAKTRLIRERDRGFFAIAIGVLILCVVVIWVVQSYAVSFLSFSFFVVGIYFVYAGAFVRSAAYPKAYSIIDADIDIASKIVLASISLHNQLYEEAKLELEKGMPSLPEGLMNMAWDNASWVNWEPRHDLDPPKFLYIGKAMTPGVPAPTLLIPFLNDHGLMFEASAEARVQAALAIQSMLLRYLALLPPGRLSFTFIDPVGRGNNVAGFLCSWEIILLNS